VLLLHGFPSLSLDWCNQVSHLQGLGYGLIVPDMLGYGGTAKPTDPQQYAASLIVKDITDIIDAENIDRCIVVGHDWGSKITARLANYCPDRFIAFGFLAVGYFPPNTQNTYEQTIASLKQSLGTEHIGYQAFLAEPGAHAICEKNFDSFYSLIHARDAATLWPEHISHLGATKAWVEENKQTELNPNIPADLLDRRKALLLEGGLEAPFCWYKVMVGDVDRNDNKQIPLAAYAVEKPVFFGVALLDTVAMPEFAKQVTAQFCKNLTVKEFSGGHWVMWDNKDEVNAELAAWLKTLDA